MKKNGFTLLEVIAVLVVMGILSVVAMNRLMSDRGETRAAADNLRTHLRYAQFQAMHSDTTWGIHATGSSYALFSGGNTANRVRLPGQNTDTVTPPVSVDTFTISFNEWGTPFGVANPTGATPADTRLINVGSGSNAITITVTRNTGFIP